MNFSITPLAEVMSQETGDYCGLTLFDNVVTFRVSQIMDASPYELDVQLPQSATDWEHVRAMVEAAYRLGLRDGLVRLGDMA